MSQSPFLLPDVCIRWSCIHLGQTLHSLYLGGDGRSGCGFACLAGRKGEPRFGLSN